jgi:retinoid hydroxylase
MTNAESKSFDEMPTVEFTMEEHMLDYPLYLVQLVQEHGSIFKRRMSPEFSSQFGSGWQVIMVGAEANKFVMHTHRHCFSHEKGWSPVVNNVFGKGLLNTDGEEHDRPRKMMNPAFTLAYMQKYLPIMQKVIERRTAEWADQSEIDLWQATRKITFDVAAEALIGLETGARIDRLRELFYTLLYSDVETGETVAEFWQRHSLIRQELDGILLTMINARRENPTDDILGILVQAKDDDGNAFTDEQLLGQLHVLLIAGHETSTTASAWLLALLAMHPAYLARVEAELATVLAEHNGAVTLEAIKAMKLLENALDETGRMYPPVTNVPRGVVQEFEFGGYKVPVGVPVRLSLVASHYLPEVFPEPQKFDPDRFAPPREEDKHNPYSLVTFGGGPRICIGLNFATVEIKALAAHVLRQYKLTVPENAQYVNAFTQLVSIPITGINMKVEAK